MKNKRRQNKHKGFFSYCTFLWWLIRHVYQENVVKNSTRVISTLYIIDNCIANQAKPRKKGKNSVVKKVICCLNYLQNYSLVIFNKRAVSDKLIPNLQLMYLLFSDVEKVLPPLGFEPTLFWTILICSYREVLGSNPIYVQQKV